MNAKEKILTIPKIMENKIIQCLTDDYMLDEIANIIREFLHVTWLINPNEEYFEPLKKQNLINPINQLLTSKLNLPKENLQVICKHIVKPFLDSELSANIVEKPMLTTARYFNAIPDTINLILYLKRSESLKKFTFGSGITEMSRKTEFALKKIMSRQEHVNILNIIIDNQRRDQIKNYYNCNLGKERYDACQFIRHGKIHWGWFIFMMAVVILASSFYEYSNFKFHSDTINTRKFDLLETLLEFILKPLLITFAAAYVLTTLSLYQIYERIYENQQYIINQSIIKQILKNINTLNINTLHPEKNKKTQTQKYPQKIFNEKTYNNNNVINVTDEPSSKSNNSESNNQEIVQQKEKDSPKKFKYNEIAKKIEEIDKRLRNHKDNSGTIKSEITWKYKKENKLIEKIYHPLRDMFKIIELWTFSPTKKALNNQHYMIWNKENIKNLLGKNKQLYSDFSRIGKIGRIANSENEQGYIQCEGYEKHPWKIKSLSKESGAYRMFFTPISTTKRASDSKDVTLYEAIEFRKTH